MRHLLFTLILFAFSSSYAETNKSVMAWSAFSEKEDAINIHLRLAQADGSDIERKITNGGSNITPTLQIDGSIIWLAWIDRSDAGQFTLHYAVLLKDGLQLIESGTVPTVNNQVYAPSIVISPQGTPWLSWAGFDGNDEDIQISHYETGSWTAHRAITNNDTPDVRPTFSVASNGELILSWKQLMPDGNRIAKQTIAPIENYVLFGTSPTKDIILYKKRMAKRHPFTPDSELPAALEKYRGQIIMGTKANW